MQSEKKLSDFYHFDIAGANNVKRAGNQYGLLKKNECFQTSQLTCVTCHSPHKNEEGNLRLFSQKCMTCHNEAHGIFCKINPAPKTINANCIDCHMPEQASKSIVLQLENNKIPTAQFLRTHDIAIYPEATKEFIKNEKRNQAGLN
ncbi:MAG: cytochrome c3 family protein [Ginsengibacter sp.]